MRWPAFSVDRVPRRAPSAAPTAGRGAVLLPPAASWEVALALDLIVVLGVAHAASALAPPRAVLAWLAALTFAVTFPLALRRSLAGRSLATAIGLWALCGLALQALVQGAAAPLVSVVAIIQASRFAPPLGPVLALAAGLGYEAATLATAHALNLGSLVSSAMGLAFAYLAAASYRRLQEEKRTTEALLREVTAGRDARVRAAAFDERARLARINGDVELTHLRQFGLTHLFQVARSWRVPSSLVDADRGLCHLA